MKKTIRTAVIMGFLPFAFFMMTSFGGSKTPSTPEGWDLSALTLNDGVYRGESSGFHDGLIVDVTVVNGAVTEVVVVDHDEQGAQYYKRPIDLIPGEIVESQNTLVDGVTGATFTSMGIMSAVEDALAKAQN
ncbi:MAG: FMN-binding protein [Spirochaetales bacterium]|nr:FMN-binding protein [Spirochaetales bacterium]